MFLFLHYGMLGLGPNAKAVVTKEHFAVTTCSDVLLKKNGDGASRELRNHPGLFFLCRHSRFGGSYIVQGLKSIGERDLIFHKGLHNVSMLPSGVGTLWSGGPLSLWR